MTRQPFVAPHGRAPLMAPSRGSGASAELIRALAALCEPPEPEHARLGRLLGLPGAPNPAEHTGLFLLELYPYASPYLGNEGMLGGEARDRVAGFWRAVGRRPPPEPDHLTSLLSLYAALLEEAEAAGADARGALVDNASRALLWEHLLSWLGPWLVKAEELAPPFYAAWAALLRRVLLAEATRAGPPAKLPLHLRAAPALADPRRGGREDREPFLRSVLAAIRSGLVITRSDLHRAGVGLGLGVRKGERLYALRALLEQDAASTLRWLAAEARSWTTRHAAGWATRAAADRTSGPEAVRAGAVAPLSDWWRDRAARTAALLERLADDVAATGGPTRSARGVGGRSGGGSR